MEPHLVHHAAITARRAATIRLVKRLKPHMRRHFKKTRIGRKLIRAEHGLKKIGKFVKRHKRSIEDVALITGIPLMAVVAFPELTLGGMAAAISDGWGAAGTYAADWRAARMGRAAATGTWRGGDFLDKMIVFDQEAQQNFAFTREFPRLSLQNAW